MDLQQYQEAVNDYENAVKIGRSRGICNSILKQNQKFIFFCIFIFILPFTCEWLTIGPKITVLSGQAVKCLRFNI